MKKTLAIILSAMMCLSLCACKNSENNSDTSSDVQNESTPTETTAPAEEVDKTEPAYETVELTLENWQDYFEFREIKKIKINGFGEFNGADVLYYLVTKDGIELDTKSSSVTVRYLVTTEYKPCSVDLEKKTIVYGKAVDTETNPRVVDFDVVTMSDESGTENRFGKYVGNVIISNLHEDKIKHIVNLEVTNITGSISILNDN